MRCGRVSLIYFAVMNWFHFSVVYHLLRIASIPVFNWVIMFSISIQSSLISDCSVFIIAYFFVS